MMCRMVTVETINESSPHLETVKQLARQHKKTLGPMPAGAFDEAAGKGHILVALDDGKCVGYLFYRVAHGRASITHFCVANEVRRTGVAQALPRPSCQSNEALPTHSVMVPTGLRGKQGLAATRVSRCDGTGRAHVDGSVLVCWQMDHDHPEIFGEDGPTTASRLRWTQISFWTS